MKKDNSNPKQFSSIINDEQKNIKIASTTNSPKPIDNDQADNHLQIKKSHKPSQLIKDNEKMDAVKVAEIKQAINEGRFKVNSEKIADRLLEVLKELIQSKK